MHPGAHAVSPALDQPHGEGGAAVRTSSELPFLARDALSRLFERSGDTPAATRGPCQDRFVAVTPA